MFDKMFLIYNYLFEYYTYLHCGSIEPVRFDYPVRNVSAKRNDPVTLTCQARGDEPIKITWTRNGVPIEIHNYR